MVRNINMLTIIFILGCMSYITCPNSQEDCVNQMIEKGLMKKLKSGSYTDAEGWEKVAGRIRSEKEAVKDHVRAFLLQYAYNALHSPGQHCIDVGNSNTSQVNDDEIKYYNARFDPNDRTYIHN